MQTLSSDTRQSSLWSGMPMPAKSSENEPQTDGSPTCQCGKGMSDCSIHPSTPEKWIASMRDSLVLICRLPEVKRVLALRQGAAFTERSSVSLAQFDPSTSSLKMSQQSFLEDSSASFPTWPRWGTMRNGVVSEHQTSVQDIQGIGGGALQPTAQLGSVSSTGTSLTLSGWGDMDAQTAKVMGLIPTPRTTDCETPSMPRTKKIQSGESWHKYQLREALLSMREDLSKKYAPPSLYEEVMMFPQGFTKSADWVTPKFRCKPRLPGNSLGANDEEV